MFKKKADLGSYGCTGADMDNHGAPSVLLCTAQSVISFPIISPRAVTFKEYTNLSPNTDPKNAK